MTVPATRVAFMILDAMPHRYVSRDLTPHLWDQVEQGGRAPAGGLSLPVSVTYSNHAAFVTGLDSVTTRITGNHAWTEDGFVQSHTVGPRGSTVFDWAKEADRRTVMVCGDEMLHMQMGSDAASQTWPYDGRKPAGVGLDPFGYPSDDAVLEGAGTVDFDADLVVMHLGEPDTHAHLYGPESPEAIDRYRRTDRAYDGLLDHLRPWWHETIVITVSDHDQETVDYGRHIDLGAELDDLDVAVAIEGTSCVVKGNVDLRRLRSVDGVESAALIGDDFWEVWCEPGRVFGTADYGIKGQHGSPRCRTQLSMISGGHPRVPELARWIESTQPTSLTWAPLIAGLLDLPMTVE